MRGWMMSLAAAALLIAPASASWKIMPRGTPVTVAKSALTVTPPDDWNKWSRRPTKRSEIWTIDGTALNELAFYAGIADGEALLKDRNKKDRPLPRFSSKMLAPDLVQLYEATGRIVLQTSLFEVDVVEPAKLAGHDAVRFTYRYTVQGDEVRRKGEARAAVIGGKLYMMTFAAPEIHYHDASIAQARAIMDSAKL